MLSEGRTIYNGPPVMVKDYFEQFGLKMSRFSNPADKLSRVASEPLLVLDEGCNTIFLEKQCQQKLA